MDRQKTVKHQITPVLSMLLLFLSTGCFEKGEVSLAGLNNLKAGVHKISNQDGKLVIEGQNLDTTRKVILKGDSLDNEMVIQSQNESKIVAALSQALTLTAGTVYELILSNAHGQSVYQLSFEIQDEQVTTVKLADGAVTGAKISDMGALSGQVLKYNGTSWNAADLNSLVYAGTWDASTGTQPSASPVGGDFWIVDTDGDVDLGDGNGLRQWRVGDWIVYNDVTTQWDQVISSQSVVSFNGRAGEVVPDTNDYTWQQIDKTTAPIDDLTDVDTTSVAPATGEVLKWDGTNWTPQADDGGSGDITSVTAGTGLTGGATTGDATLDVDVGTGSGQIPQLDASGLLLNSIIPGLDAAKVTSGTMDTARLPLATDLVDGIITAAEHAKLNSTDTTLSGGSAGEYLDGDGSWKVLNTSAVPEGTNLYYTAAAARADVVDDAIGDGVTNKAPSQNAVFDALALKADDGSLSDYVLKAGDTMGGALGLPVDGLSVGTDQLVVSGGKVGIGTTSAEALLDISGDLTTSLTGTVDITSGSPTVVAGDVSTQFVTDGLSAGESIKIDGNVYVISSIDSETQITLSTNASTTADEATVYEESGDNLFLVKDGAGNELFKVTPSGVSSSAGIASSSTSNTGETVIESDTDTSGNEAIIFNTSGSTKASLDSSGNFDLGSDLGFGSSDLALSIGNGSAPAVLALGEDANNNSAMTWNNTDNYLTFSTENASTTHADTLVLRDGRIGVGTNNPDESAIMDLSSTDKGFLPPRMTTVQRNAISSPVAGLSIYNTDTGKVDVYDGSNWNTQELSGKVSAYVQGYPDYLICSDGTRTHNYKLQYIDASIVRYRYTYTSSDFHITFNLSGDYVSQGNSAGMDCLNKPLTTLVSEGKARFLGNDIAQVTADDDGDTFINVEAAADQDAIRMSTGGSEKMVIDSNGNVGVGISSPVEKLEVQGNIHAKASNIMVSNGGSAYGTSMYSPASNELAFSANSTEAIRVDSAGNVGIGTSTPNAKLDVNGKVLFGDSSTNYDSMELETMSTPLAGYEGTTEMKAATIPGSGEAAHAFHFKTIGSTGVTRADVLVDGNVGIGTTSPDQKLDVTHTSASYGAAGIISQRSDTGDNVGVGIYNSVQKWDLANITSAGTDFFAIRDSTQATTPFAITTTGNTGIGTTSPTKKLSVNGGGLQVLSGGHSGIYEDNSFIIDFDPVSSNATRLWSIGTGTTKGRFDFHIRDGSSSDLTAMTIDNSGQVGVGATTPSAELHIAKDNTGGDEITALRLTELIGTDAHYELRVTNTSGSTGEVNYFSIWGGEAGSEADKFILTRTGSAGIGTVSPADKLHVAGDVRVGTGTTGCVKDADATVIAGTCSSDERFKKDIRELEKTGPKLAQLRPVRYFWRKEEFPDKHFGESEQIGLIAQEVAKVFPELVERDEEGFYRVRYSDLNMMMLQGLGEHQEQLEEVQELKREIASIKAEKDAEIAELKAKNQEMENFLCEKFSEAPFCQ